MKSRYDSRNGRRAGTDGGGNGNGNGRGGAGVETGHPIGVVARRTAIPPDLLRAWEKRYGAVTPQRTVTGRRLYTDEDIQRLRLLKTLVEGRRRISDVAGLPLESLKSLAKEDAREAVVPAQPRPRPPAAKPEQLLHDALDAVAALDRQRLVEVLNDAAVAFPPARVRQDLLVPLLQTIGERWQEGSMRIAQEHMASALVRAFLSAAGGPPDPAQNRPVAVVTTPSGHQHEIGALLAAATAKEAGWDVIYLGSELPAEEVAAAALQSQATAVLFSVIFPVRDAATAEELRRVRRYLGAGYPILVGGRAAPSYDEVLTEIGAVAIENLSELHGWLARIAG